MEKVAALSRQTGGNHYKDMAIQPAEYIHKNGIGFLEGNAIKYASRWKKKGGLQDLQKAVDCLEMLIQIEEAKQSTAKATPDKHEHPYSVQMARKPVYSRDGSVHYVEHPVFRPIAPTPSWPWPGDKA